MKNLLYTLLIGLVIVSCNKEDLGSGNAPLALSTETAVELSKSEILDIVNNVLNITPIKGSTKGNISTQKGTDRISMHLFIADTVIYATYLSEDNDDLCLDNSAQTVTPLASVHLNNSANGIEVTLNEDTTVINTVSGDFTTLFGLPLNILLKLDANNAVDNQAVFGDDNSVTF